MEFSLAIVHLPNITVFGGTVTMYQVLDEMRVLRLEDNAIIPVCDENTDYQAYLVWVQDGGVALPPTPIAPLVPQSVTRYQARAALLQAGLLSAVEDYFAALPETSLARLAWQEAPTVNRASDALESAVAALGLKGEQLDELFINASMFD